MEIKVLQWNILAKGLANDGFLLHRPGEEPKETLDRARSVQVLGQELKQRIKQRGPIKLKDLPEEMKTWEAPPFNFAQRLQSNFEEVLQEEQRYLEEITDAPKRCQMILQKIQEEQPDVIAMQEVDMFDELNSMLEAEGYSANAKPEVYREYAERVKDLAAEGGSGKKYAEILREYTGKGLSVCPNFNSTARKHNPMGFDDGICIFWNTKTLEAREPPDAFVYDMKEDAPALRAKLRLLKSNTPLDVLTLHLPSGPQKELRRLLNLWQLHEFLPENDVPCILAVDLNSDAHLEPPMAQEVELVASDGCKKVEIQLGEPLRATSFQVLQGEHAAAPQYKHPADLEMAKDMALQVPSWGLKSAWQEVESIPLSVVKMRGPASEQVKKWGELTLETTDHVFCSHHFHVLHCDTGLPSYNHQQKQDLLKRFRNAKAEEVSDLHHLVSHLLPSATVPSDHMCVLARLQLNEAYSISDRVVIVASKQSKTVLRGTVRFIGSTDFASGLWLGVELDSKAGKNDGSVKGKSYFQCPAEYGLFLRPQAVEKLEKASKAVQGEDSLRTEKVRVQEALALAIEDHDIQTIERELPTAQNLEIDPKEIAAARQILEYVASQNLTQEVKTIRAAVAHLKRSVTALEVAPSQTPALYHALEQRMWQKAEVVLQRVLGSRAKAFEAADSAPCRIQRFVRRRWRKRHGGADFGEVVEMVLQHIKASEAAWQEVRQDASKDNFVDVLKERMRWMPPAQAEALWEEMKDKVSKQEPLPGAAEAPNPRQTFRKNVFDGLKDGSLETMVKAAQT